MEARLIEQDHRFVATWSTFLNRKQWNKGDPRRRAAVVALLWRFVPRAVPMTVAVSVGALFTLLLAFKANQLIDVQNNLAEAQRRSSLNIEISAIMDEINKEVKENTGKERPKEGYRLRGITEARVIALSRSLEPYRSLKTSENKENSLSVFFDMSNVLDNPLNKEFLSPERGQLILSLAGLHLHEKYDVSQIIGEGNFTQARLTGANLNEADLIKATLTGANLSGALLYRVKLNDARLELADLSGADLDRAELEDAKLRGANLTKATLTSANLKSADLRGADLTKANLAYATLKSADLRGADLSKADLAHANLKSADLRGAKLGSVRRVKDMTIESAKISKDAAEPFKSWALKNHAKLVDHVVEGVVVTEIGSDEKNAFCSPFRMTRDQVISFFDEAEKETHEIIKEQDNWSPCYVRGKLVYEEKPFQFEIRARGTVYIKAIDSDLVIWFACLACVYENEYD